MDSLQLASRAPAASMSTRRLPVVGAACSNPDTRQASSAWLFDEGPNVLLWPGPEQGDGALAVAEGRRGWESRLHAGCGATLPTVAGRHAISSSDTQRTEHHHRSDRQPDRRVKGRTASAATSSGLQQQASQCLTV